MNTTTGIGKQLRDRRKKIAITQAELALTSGTGIRFISDLERGKPTCQLGKVLDVINTLGLNLKLEER